MSLSKRFRRGAQTPICNIDFWCEVYLREVYSEWYQMKCGTHHGGGGGGGGGAGVLCMSLLKFDALMH